MAPTDDIVKDKAHKYTRYEVNWRCRRQVPRAGKDDREVDVLEEIDFELLVQDPLE